MKVNINRQSGIVTLPQDVITLEDITKDGRYHYVVKYNVDIARAIKNKCSIVKIHVSATPPDNRDVVGFSRLNTNQIVQSLLTRQSERVEINRSFTQNFITSFNSDFTAVIPNSKAKDLARNIQALDSQGIETQAHLFENRRFDLVRASDLTQRNISQPILQTPLFQPLLSNVTPAQPTQENSFALIMRHGIDPSAVALPSNTYADTERVQAGVVQRPTGVAREVLQGTPLGSVRPSFGLLSTLVGEQRTRPADQTGLSSNDFAHVMVVEKTNVATIVEDLYLNVSDVGDQFYLMFVLQDIDGIEAETVSSLVQHSRNLAIFTLPTVAPFLSVIPVNGQNRLEIKQLDPNGAGVYVYRRVIDTHSAITEADYIQVTKLPLRVQDGTKWFVDRNPGMRPVIYRVISYNRSELKSHEFSSAVVNPTQKVLGVQAFAQQRRLFVSMNAKVIDRTIQVELNDIPNGVVSIRVYRQDLSRHDTLEQSTLVGDAIFIPSFPTRDSRFYVTDTTPVDQRSYQYTSLLIFKDGGEFWSTTPVSIQFNPILNNVISTVSSPIQSANTGAELDVTFTLSSVVTEGKIDQIKKAMEQQGILGFFQADITQNREKLQNLIAYQVKRTDLTTGEVSDMGVFIGTQFSDRAIGKNIGVKPLVSGHVYEYTVSTHFRSAQSLISTYTTTVTNATNPSRDYTYSPSKWQHPVTLRDGNIVSVASLKRNHASSDFTFGTVGDIIHLRIDLSNNTPSIHDATANVLGKGKVLVQWKLKGSTKKIDHFIVTKEEMDMKTMVGKTHGLTDSNLQFIDTPMVSTQTRANPAKNPPTDSLTELETAVTYHITPVFYDYTHGVSIKSPQTITRKMQ